MSLTILQEQQVMDGYLKPLYHHLQWTISGLDRLAQLRASIDNADLTAFLAQFISDAEWQQARDDMVLWLDALETRAQMWQGAGLDDLVGPGALP